MEDKAIVQLVSFVGSIKPAGNFLEFSMGKSYGAYELVNAKADTAKIKKMLNQMGIMDIPVERAMTLEVNYTYAVPQQKRLLDKIVLAKKRMDALNVLYYNGGMELKPAEKEYFDTLAQINKTLRATDKLR